MDGFHLSNDTLIAWGRRGRKGAWDTFDAEGYVQLLRRLRNQEEGDRACSRLSTAMSTNPSVRRCPFVAMSRSS
jgi:pantothenate kinase